MGMGNEDLLGRFGWEWDIEITSGASWVGPRERYLHGEKVIIPFPEKSCGNFLAGLFPRTALVFSHMMATLRKSTTAVVLLVVAALHATVLEFWLFCLVCGLCCCSFCLFLVRLLSLMFLSLHCFPSCFCSIMYSGEGGLNPAHHNVVLVDFQYSSSSTRSQLTST